MLAREKKYKGGLVVRRCGVVVGERKYFAWESQAVKGVSTTRLGAQTMSSRH